MLGTIKCSDRTRRDWPQALEFVQNFFDRLAFGWHRYEARTGGPVAANRYMTRLALELKAYRRTGNRKHLLNIASYAYLETQAPENKRFHWNSAVESVTRHI